ncbi:MAG: lipid-A-disaccharide synthase [Xanthomonadaceae bacterium]|nr:lipid-A-disaccharide synthase [Xanthomonadaceae bacterium]MDP2184092.1 lipid-A-disaccharide synthase [Xanthomonadales bacterium]MDZ4115187.1 lipid-A-disaccharide synthase [Xanthomonadaceae bacterium]MDZ4377033.1 lipid-A-disaccharide synthase [Xanthomonadaceae bacterium]
MSATSTRPLRIALVAGEASGDSLGGGLMTALRQRLGAVSFAGIGGPQMREAGLDGWHDCSELAVMGLTEVLRHLPRLLRLRRQLDSRLEQWQPDLYIGIDAPDFNLPVERRLKARGVTTVHYVSPSVWAWRGKRAQRMGESADCVLCLFPMEPPIYQRFGVDARFVGHPLADAYAMEPDQSGARAQLGLSDDTRVLAVLPGSRIGEIQRLLPTFLDAVAELHEATPGLQVLIPAANGACADAIHAMLANHALATKPNVLDGQASIALLACDAVLLASGTAALEALLAKRPMVVAYRIAALTHTLVMRLGLMQVRRYSLPNALAGHLLVPELMQHDCRPAAITAALLPWLQAPGASTALLPAYRAIHQQLRGNASAKAADAVIDMLARRR